MKLKDLFKTKEKKLEESILYLSSSIDAIFKKYEHLYVSWYKNNFCYVTKNYMYTHKSVAWNDKIYDIWKITPTTVDNDLTRIMKHRIDGNGIYPEDWIVKNKPNTKSMPPNRLLPDILIELEAHLLSEGLKKVKTDLKTHTEHPVKPEPIEPIDNRFEILDL